jgi:hypothetical protein
MSVLRSGGSHNQAWVPFYTQLQIQTSSNAVPITILYGTNRIAPNVIWSGGFFAIPQYQGSSGGHGKGGGGGQGNITGWTYYSSLAMGVCEGPITGYRSNYDGQNHWWNLYSTDLSFFQLGNTPQGPWGFLTADWPSQALGYNGLAYVGGVALNLGSSANIPQFSFEVMGRLFSTAVVNGFDADPALIIQDFLTNPQYGVGFPAASIDATTLLTQTAGDASYQNYCQAAYLALSPALVNKEAANSIMTRWLKFTNSTAVWSAGKLKFIPCGDQSITGTLQNGTDVTFNPNVTPAYNLADDDFIHEDGKDPVEVTRADPYALSNWQRVSIRQRFGNNYEATPIDVWDQNAIETYGLRMASDITADEICDPNVGQIAAQLILQRGLYIRNTYKFKLSFEYCLLEPMDIVTVTDSDLGLSQTQVRITEIEEEESGLLAVTAEEFVPGVSTATQYQTSLSSPNSTNQGIVPARVNEPIIFEPPAALNGGTPQVWIAASGGIAPVYHLAEDGSTGQHLTSQALVSSESAGTIVTFAAYVQAAERSACRLNITCGGTTSGCDFNLSTGVAGTPDTGGTASMTNAGLGTGSNTNPWYLCTVQVAVAAGTPTVSILIETVAGSTFTSSYTGTSGDGINIWGAEAAVSSAPPTFLPAFSSTTGASLATVASSTTTPPEGTQGTADPNWGGANVWLSTDNATYNQFGTITAPARMGALTASLSAPSGGNPDTADALSVSLLESGGTLSGTTALNAQNGLTLCLVDNELLSFVNATLTGTNAYNLTTLYRGQYGTSPASHSSGASFARLDNAIFKIDLPAAFIGVEIYVKLQSFNIFGQSTEDLSECTVYTYTPNGGGLPLGPVSQALALGQNLDYQLASQPLSESDDWGSVTDATIAVIDLGNCTS